MCAPLRYGVLMASSRVGSKVAAATLGPHFRLRYTCSSLTTTHLHDVPVQNIAVTCCVCARSCPFFAVVESFPLRRNSAVFPAHTHTPCTVTPPPNTVGQRFRRHSRNSILKTPSRIYYVQFWGMLRGSMGFRRLQILGWSISRTLRELLGEVELIYRGKNKNCGQAAENL